MTKDAQIIELESILETCQKFLELIPIEALSKGLVWMPSDVALELGRQAKMSLNRYVYHHLHSFNNA